MRTVFGVLGVVSVAVLWASPVAAEQPGSLPTVISKGTAPGNGDLDENGTVSSVDALLVSQIVATGKMGNGKVPTVQGFHQGDANLNGRLDNEDARLILQRVVGLITLPKKPFKPGDANGDGSISAVDALLVAQYLENLLSTLPMMYNADANQDYFVDRRDADCIMSTIMRMDVGGQRCY